MSLHRARAKRNLRMAQISALGLVALAGLLAAMPPAPGSAPSKPGTTPPGPGATTPPGPGAQSGVAYQTALATFQSRVAKSEPVIPEKPQEEPENGGNVTPGDDVPPATIDDGPPHFRYVGMVSSPRRTYAFIAEAGGESRTLAQGEYYDDHGEWLVLAISSEKMIISDCNDNMHEYVIADRPETPAPEATLGLSNTAAPKASAAKGTTGINPKSVPGAEGEHIYNPAGVVDPAERERIAEKMREIEDRRNQAMSKTPGTTSQNVNRPASQPPPRPGNGPPAKPNGASKKDLK